MLYIRLYAPFVNQNVLYIEHGDLCVERSLLFKKRKRVNNPVFKTFVFNAVNLSTKMAKDILAQLASSELNYVTVPQDQNFRKAQGVRQTIQQFGAKSETIAAFQKLAGLLK